jgi:hypothetical protein
VVEEKKDGVIGSRRPALQEGFRSRSERAGRGHRRTLGDGALALESAVRHVEELAIEHLDQRLIGFGVPGAPCAQQERHLRGRTHGVRRAFRPFWF